jgi:hypothetical protein
MCSVSTAQNGGTTKKTGQGSTTLTGDGASSTAGSRAGSNNGGGGDWYVDGLLLKTLELF